MLFRSVGSRWTFEALLGMVGRMLLLCSLTPEISPQSLRADRCGLLLAGILVSVSVSVWHRARHGAPREIGDEPVWIDFQTVFGMVWSRRIQDRVNEQGRNKGWPVRLGPRGWQDESGQPLGLVGGNGEHRLGSAEWQRTRTTPAVNEARSFLLWLLQKFVEPEWVARHDVHWE